MLFIKKTGSAILPISTKRKDYLLFVFFDLIVQSMLFNGCEGLGFCNTGIIESVHLKICNFYSI